MSPLKNSVIYIEGAHDSCLKAPVHHIAEIYTILI